MATKTTLRTGSLLAATVLFLPIGIPAAEAAAPRPGASTLNDRLFPGLGNGGYDALSYDVSLDYRTGTTKMPASVTMRARATQSLSSFSLDSAGQQISLVTVDGRPAQYKLAKEKLTITPARPLYKYLPFTVRVVYTADRSQNPVSPGLDLPPGVPSPFTVWNETPDGFGVMGQPNREHVVFPSNDHPSDKAQYTLRITAPNDRTGVASGRLQAKYWHGATTTWVYRTAHPIKTDVVAIAVGKFRTIKQTGPHGLPLRAVRRARPHQPVRRGRAGDGRVVHLRTPTLAGREGRGRDAVHEMTHQYFGDAVSVRSWDDMWISEGHARYYERKYDASRGFTNLDQEPKDLYEADQQSRSQAGPMGQLNNQLAVLFDTDVPGQLMLTGLDTLVGDPTFRRIEQTFFDRYRDRDASTQDYIDVANEVSGRDLTQYFRAWIYGKTTPPMPERRPGCGVWRSGASSGVPPGRVVPSLRAESL